MVIRAHFEFPPGEAQGGIVTTLRLDFLRLGNRVGGSSLTAEWLRLGGVNGGTKLFRESESGRTMPAASGAFNGSSPTANLVSRH
jgi:hypothetical protein